MRKIGYVLLIGCVTFSCSPNQSKIAIWITKDDLTSQVEKFKDYPLTEDLTPLTADEQEMLPHLRLAMNEIDTIFWKQISADGLALKSTLEKQPDSLSQLALKLVNINCGPFDMDNNKVRIAGYGSTPHAGFNLYPNNYNIKDIRELIENNPSMEKKIYAFNTILYENEDRLVSVPYEKYFESNLKKVQQHLRDAANLTSNESLKSYLTILSEELLNGNYRRSDSAWVKVTGTNLEYIIGPIDSYYDDFLHTKTFYDGLLGVKNVSLEKKIKLALRHLSIFNQSLPNAEQWLPKDLTIETPVPINILKMSGGLNFSYKNITVYLPERGSDFGNNSFTKNLILENVFQAKFESIMIPICQLLLDTESQKLISAEQLIISNALYESAQEVEPTIIQGKSNQNIKTLFGDHAVLLKVLRNHIYAMFYTQKLSEFTLISQSDYDKILTSQIAELFRVLRLGGDNSEILANVMLFNLLFEYQIISYQPSTGLWSISLKNITTFITEQTNKITTILTTGDVKGLSELKSKYGTRKLELTESYKKTTHLPIDVNLIYPN